MFFNTWLNILIILRRIFMKKMISVLVSSVIGASAIASMPGSAASKKAAKEKSGLIVLGDSIASGYTVKGQIPYNYGDICGDYLGCDVSNYAVPGDDTDDLLAFIDGMTTAQKSNVADAKYIVVSIGGNDMIEYISKRLIAFAATKTDYKFFNDGYSANDIPEKITFGELMKILNIRGEGGIEEYAGKGMSSLLELSNVVGDIGADLSSTKGDNEGYIVNTVIPKVQKVSDKLKAINPDAKIIVQNVYQPFQFEPTFVETNFGSTSNKARILNIVRYQLEAIMDAYTEGLQSVDGIDVVDVKAQFTSLDKEPSNSAPGHANYFVDIQTQRLSEADIHPNQKGHLAIAAAILDKIGDLHDDKGLLSEVYNSLSDKGKYPEIALETYKKVAGKEAVVTTSTTSTTTTTTTTSTTKKPTTTSTTSTTTTSTTKKPTTTSTTTTSTTTQPVTTTTTQPATKLMLGDVNDDKHIDSVDASQLLREYALVSTAKTSIFDGDQKTAGDVDKNGMIDSVDASKVLSYYAYASNTSGVIKSLEEFLKK
jgi:lysophospholipase L1-like esterase